MLMTTLALLLALWMLGVLTSTTMGGLVHLLGATAFFLFAAGILSRRRSLD